MAQNFNELIMYSKTFSGLTPELEVCLKDIAPVITPHLKQVTDSFYEQLATIPAAEKYLAGRIEHLKAAHLKWMINLFELDVDAQFAEGMYKVGDIHVKVNLPVEFMAGAMTLINTEIIKLVIDKMGSDLDKCSKALQAINAVTGLALMIMQQSYQESSIAEELEKFLKISGMSRTLFTNLAKAYN
ncbi:MAG: protoglobin domain-containing protein [Methylobacter sp.]|nr:protoglobin domain-containing protein [Methylococcales bacterium]MDD5112563.1 protoglobin domain-containing protein [Methylobacter sp.]